MAYKSKYKVKIPKLNEELAYLCGFLLGDGSINIREEKHDYCIQAVGNPKDEQEYYDIVIKELFLKVFNIPINTQPHNKGTTYGFHFSSKMLVKHLTEKLKVPKSPKYNNLIIPPAFYSDKQLLKACIRGIFDTDGCVSFKKRYKNSPYYPVISISSKSSSFIKEIDAILLSFGLKGLTLLDYRVNDPRLRKGYSLISRIEFSGHKKLDLWMDIIGTWHFKHHKKITRHRKK